MRVAATRLADEQLRLAEAAFHHLEGRTQSLAFYLDYALTNYRGCIDGPFPAGQRLEEELDRAARDVHDRRALRKSRAVIDVRTLDTAYRAFYRQIGFTPQQTGQFVALAFENAGRHEALDKLAGEQGMKVNDPKMQPLYAQADAEFHAKFRRAPMRLGRRIAEISRPPVSPIVSASSSKSNHERTTSLLRHVFFDAAISTA